MSVNYREQPDCFACGAALECTPAGVRCSDRCPGDQLDGPSATPSGKFYGWGGPDDLCGPDDEPEEEE